jgi:hypothetical protein
MTAIRRLCSGVFYSNVQIARNYTPGLTIFPLSWNEGGTVRQIWDMTGRKETFLPVFFPKNPRAYLLFP